MSRKGSRVVGRLGRNKDVDRLKQGLHRGQVSRGGSDKELASTSASIPFPSPLLLYENAFHQSPTKYIHGDPKISSRSCPSKTSLSQQNGCRVFSMKSVRWLKTNGANCTPRRKRKPPPPPRAFSIVNFPFFVSYPRRYSCRLTIARLHKEICFRQSSIPNV